MSRPVTSASGRPSSFSRRTISASALRIASEPASPPGISPNSAGVRSAASPFNAYFAEREDRAGIDRDRHRHRPGAEIGVRRQIVERLPVDRDLDHAVVAGFRIERGDKLFAVGPRLGQQAERSGNRTLDVLDERGGLVERLLERLVVALDRQCHRVVAADRRYPRLPRRSRKALKPNSSKALAVGVCVITAVPDNSTQSRRRAPHPAVNVPIRNTLRPAISSRLTVKIKIEMKF